MLAFGKAVSTFSPNLTFMLLTFYILNHILKKQNMLHARVGRKKK